MRQFKIVDGVTEKVSVERIRIVDEIMGSGKTTAAINYIWQNKDKKIIYATPFTAECGRIITACPFMETPQEDVCDGAKRGSFFWLAENGKSIVTTHALLEKFGKAEFERLKELGYDIFILDETIAPIDCKAVYTHDFKGLVKDGHIKIADNGKVIFSKDYDGSLSEVKVLADTRDIFLAHPLEKHKARYTGLIISTFPDLWDCFKEIWVLTYSFENSYLRCYFDKNNISYDYCCLYKKQFVLGKPMCRPKTPKIDIYEDNKLNDIGFKREALSLSWYKRNSKKAAMRTLRNGLGNYLKNKKHAKIKDLCWTTFKDYQEEMGEGNYKGYTDKEAFLECNARARNDFQHKTIAAYMINRFMNPYIKGYLENNGIVVNEGQIMLHEMLQWLYRTAIRNGEKISLYVPSTRMRNLLKSFIEEMADHKINFTGTIDLPITNTSSNIIICDSGSTVNSGDISIKLDFSNMKITDKSIYSCIANHRKRSL